MVVDMLLVEVGCHYHLKAVAPQPLGKLKADLMGLLRRDLAGSKGLVAVKGHDPALLAKLPLDHSHLLLGNFRGAVNAAHKPLFFGLVALGGVAQHIVEALPFLLAEGGLVRIGGVAYHPAQVALDAPNGCGGHYPIFSGAVTVSWSCLTASSVIPPFSFSLPMSS